MAIILATPKDVQTSISVRFKVRRLALNMKQSDLASRSGVSLGSLKRFESLGMISFESLLKLAMALNCLSDFEKLVSETPQVLANQSLDTILAARSARRRASSGGRDKP